MSLVYCRYALRLNLLFLEWEGQALEALTLYILKLTRGRGVGGGAAPFTALPPVQYRMSSKRSHGVLLKHAMVK